jgi:hypothetical protein
MPDISPLSPSRDRQDDYSYDDPPDLARNNAVARLNGPTIPGVNEPGPASRGEQPPPTLPETPASKLDKRAFTSPALTGGAAKTPKPVDPAVTAAKMCSLAGAMWGPASTYTAANLGACNTASDPCLTPAQAALVVDTCTAPLQLASQPSVGPETGSGELLSVQEARERAAMQQQAQMQDAVRSNPLAAVVVAKDIVTGQSRETIADHVGLDNAAWGVASSVAMPVGLAATTTMPAVPTRGR